jgi:hypothetical protein
MNKNQIYHSSVTEWDEANNQTRVIGKGYDPICNIV